MSRSSVVTSQRSQQQNSGNAMRSLLADPQLTATKSNVNHAAINKQKLRQTQELNRAKQVQSELIAAQPVFKMNRFANVGSKVTQQLGNTTQRNGIASTRQSNIHTNSNVSAQPTENFYFDNAPSAVYNNAPQPTEQYENIAFNNNQPIDHDESIYNAFNQMSIQPPVVAVHSAAPIQPVSHTPVKQQQPPITRRQPSTQRQLSNNTNAKRMSLKAPLDMHNDSYNPNNNAAQRNFERDNALAVINAKSNRPTSNDTGSFKHSNHGQVPAYLQQRKAELDAIKAQKQADATRERAPAGTVRMSEEQRLETLQQLNQQLDKLNNELAQFPLRVTTEARRVARQNHENKIKEIEEAIQLFSKKVVYISQ